MELFMNFNVKRYKISNQEKQILFLFLKREEIAITIKDLLSLSLSVEDIFHTLGRLIKKRIIKVNNDNRLELTEIGKLLLLKEAQHYRCFATAYFLYLLTYIFKREVKNNEEVIFTFKDIRRFSVFENVAVWFTIPSDTKKQAYKELARSKIITKIRDDNGNSCYKYNYILFKPYIIELLASV